MATTMINNNNSNMRDNNRQVKEIGTAGATSTSIIRNHKDFNSSSNNMRSDGNSNSMRG